jgi:hypothetical protein
MTLGSGADHNDRVRIAEDHARSADMTRGDFTAFKNALIPLEKYCQDVCSMFNLNSNMRESLGAPFAELNIRCEVTSHLLDNVVSRYDRSLNLVSYPRPHSNRCYIKKCYSC